MTKKTKVLVIDDEHEICFLVKLLLTKAGYDVKVSRDPIKGLELILSRDFACVICDLSMPRMSGLELLKILRAKRNFTPFLFFSGHASSSQERDMINLGAFALVQKPNLNLILPELEKTISASKEVHWLEKSGLHALEFLEILNQAKKIG